MNLSEGLLMIQFQCIYCLNILAVDCSDMGNDVLCPTCDEVVTVPSIRLAHGVTLGEFIIREKIATWEKGKIYAAYQVSLDRDVALKTLAPPHSHDPQNVAEFVAEARNDAKLNYPHIGQIFHLEQQDDVMFYAMENIDTHKCTNTAVFLRELVITPDDDMNLQQTMETISTNTRERIKID